jgi:hypothetical protein
MRRHRLDEVAGLATVKSQGDRLIARVKTDPGHGSRADAVDALRPNITTVDVGAGRKIVKAAGS